MIDKYEHYLLDFDGTIVTLHVNWQSLKDEINILCHNFNIDKNHTLSKKINLLKKPAPHVFKVIENYEHKAKYTINENMIAFINQIHSFYVISNNLHSTIEKILREINIYHKCIQIIAIDDVNKSKPNKEAFNQIKATIKPTESLYIGDKESDEQFAINCHLNFKYIEEI